ncbi:C40 family peptidase [Lutimaribacter marinistellae]|uniref:C40 family peptidase n=1 Tax=Lutimaribacter marinistellae TaxID=1820329 RepID=A0ABV7TGN8_9RHOB
MQVARPVVDLLRRPGGPRDRQLVYGDCVEILESSGDWQRVKSDKDAYEGWLPATALELAEAPTHWVCAPSTHIYAEPDIKSADRVSLSFGSRVTALVQNERFVETPLGHIPRQHLKPAGERFTDPVAVAALFLGTPYLWGGNSRCGIDCSGLVQAAMLACGHSCPGDSGDQVRAVGEALPSGTAPRRGDLLFWKGHVAWVADPETILHANAHHMATAYEPLKAAVDRIENQGDGPVTSHKRL